MNAVGLAVWLVGIAPGFQVFIVLLGGALAGWSGYGLLTE